MHIETCFLSILLRSEFSEFFSFFFREINKMRRIIYTVTEYEPLIDSSNITSEHWRKMAEDIKVSNTNIYSVYKTTIFKKNENITSYK